jgi:hypothetical protein
MERFFKVKIKKQKAGNRDQLVYPKVLGKDFVSIAYNQAFTEALIRVDVPKKRLDEIKAHKNVTSVAKKDRDKEVKALQPEVAQSPADSAQARAPGLLLSALDNLNLLRPQLDLTEGPMLPQEDWQAPAKLQSGWKNYGGEYNPTGYFIDSLGLVHLRGLIKDGDYGKTVFELPPGYWPEHRQLHAAITALKDVGYSIGRVDIYADGRVMPVDGGYKKGVHHWISLDGIVFRAVI